VTTTLTRFKVYVEYDRLEPTTQLGQTIQYPRISGPIDVSAENPEQARSKAVAQVKASALDGIVWVSKIKRRKD
jgi:hypothetical protein